jgi:hypothetical protein
MNSQIQLGSILIEDRPGIVAALGIEIEPCMQSWSLVHVDSAEALDQQIRGVGWNWFLMTAELRVRVFGSASQMVLRRVLMLIVKKQPTQFFNCLEVTSISTKRFLGLPYTVVTANSRHIQSSWRLDDVDRRRKDQRQSEWARG